MGSNPQHTIFGQSSSPFVEYPKVFILYRYLYLFISFFLILYDSIGYDINSDIFVYTILFYIRRSLDSLVSPSTRKILLPTIVIIIIRRSIITIPTTTTTQRFPLL